jgi:uncharacterized membrane protein
LIALSCIAALAFTTAVHGDSSVYGVDLGFNDPSNVKEGHGGVAVSFTYNVTHTGTFLSENVTVELLDEQVGWSHFMAASTMAGVRSSTNILSLTLQRNEVAPLVIQVTSPIGVADGIYGMVVLVYTDKDPSVNASHDIYVKIGTLVGFELERLTQPPFDRTAVVPPGTVTLCYGLFNTGSVEDRYHIDYESSLAINGWTLSLVNGTDPDGWTPSLPSDPGKTHPHVIQLTLAVPADAKADTRCQVVINATSAINSSLRSPPLFTSIKALQNYDFMVLFKGENQITCEAGQQVEFQFKVRNLGNGWDTFTVVPVWDTELNPGFLASVNPRTVNISSNGTGLISYTARVPEAAPKKVYSLKATISSSSRDLDSKSLEFTVEVPQFFKVELTSPQPRMTTIPGGILDYEVDVRNAGNGLDSMTILILGIPSGWLTYVQPPEVSLLQNERSKVSIRVIVPSRFEEAPRGMYELTVVADSTRSDAEGRLTIQLEIAPFHRIIWMNLDQLKPRHSLNPYERDGFDITLEIRNFGNTEDNVRFSGEGVDPRVNVTVTPDSTMLLSDQTKLIKVHIEVPRELPPGEYRAFVNATSLDAAIPTEVAPLDFEVFNLDASIPMAPTLHDPEIGCVISSTITKGSQVVLWLSVRNAGTKPLGSVQVRAFDTLIHNGRNVRWNFFSRNITEIKVSCTYSFGITALDAPEPSILWSANVEGHHTIEFHVYHDHQSNTTNDVAYIDLEVVTPKPQPHSLMPMLMMLGLSLLVVAIAVTLVTYSLRRHAGRPHTLAEVKVDPASFERALPPFKPEPDKVALMPRPSPEHVALYGQDLDGEDVDQVVEKAVDLDDDEVGP